MFADNVLDLSLSQTGRRIRAAEPAAAELGGQLGEPTEESVHLTEGAGKPQARPQFILTGNNLQRELGLTLVQPEHLNGQACEPEGRL